MEKGHQREDDQADHQHHDQEAGAAAGVEQAGALDVGDLQGPAGLEGVDGLVLGAVVLEHPAHIRQERDHEQVAEHQHSPDHALEDHELEAAGLVHGEAAEQQGQADEEEQAAGQRGGHR